VPPLLCGDACADSAASPDRDARATPLPIAGAAAARVNSTTIALILPLESPTYGRAASAVKAGFVAAAARAGASARVQVIGHGDDGVLPAFATAAPKRCRRSLSAR
jgi:hypothetical protein